MVSKFEFQVYILTSFDVSRTVLRVAFVAASFPHKDRNDRSTRIFWCAYFPTHTSRANLCLSCSRSWLLILLNFYGWYE